MNHPGRVLDLGCGPNKVEGAWGVDHFSYPGVDQVLNLDEGDWDLPANHFEAVYARHVIEHVESIPDFMRRIHAVCSPGATVTIVTPHFTSIDSWTDPTHRWHLSSAWHETFTSGESYLGDQIQGFQLQSTSITFGRNLLNVIPKTMIRVKGLAWFEKKMAFRYPARNIETVLKAE